MLMCIASIFKQMSLSTFSTVSFSIAEYRPLPNLYEWPFTLLPLLLRFQLAPILQVTDSFCSPPPPWSPLGEDVLRSTPRHPPIKMTTASSRLRRETRVSGFAPSFRSLFDNYRPKSHPSSFCVASFSIPIHGVHQPTTSRNNSNITINQQPRNKFSRFLVDTIQGRTKDRRLGLFKM